MRQSSELVQDAVELVGTFQKMPFACICPCCSQMLEACTNVCRTLQSPQTMKPVLASGGRDCLMGRCILLRGTGVFEFFTPRASMHELSRYQEQSMRLCLLAGGDWGGDIVFTLGSHHSANCKAVHTNFPIAVPKLRRLGHLSQFLNSKLPILNQVSGHCPSHSPLSPSHLQCLRLDSTAQQ